jgi:tetratricopeptide (TPR) repeat protein
LAFICRFGSFSIEAQNYPVHIADSLFHAYHYEAAALEYEKCIFKNKDFSINEYALMQRAYCFKNIGKYYEAYQNFQRLDIDNYNDSLKCVYNFQIGLMLYLSNYFYDADTYLQRNFNLPINTLEYQNSILLNVLVLNELCKYSEARNKLSVYATNNTKASLKDSAISIINTYYSYDAIPKIKSLNKARKLSKILPGAGLFYIGKSGRAFGNITLLLAAATYTGLNIFYGNYFTAATAGIHLIRLFYTGGINQLNDIVPIINNTHTRIFNDKIKSKLLCLF